MVATISVLVIEHGISHFLLVWGVLGQTVFPRFITVVLIIIFAQNIFYPMNMGSNIDSMHRSRDLSGNKTRLVHLNSICHVQLREERK